MGSQWDSPLNLPVYQQDVIPPYVAPITFPEAPVPPGGDGVDGGFIDVGHITDDEFDPVTGDYIDGGGGF